MGEPSINVKPKSNKRQIDNHQVNSDFDYDYVVVDDDQEQHRAKRLKIHNDEKQVVYKKKSSINSNSLWNNMPSNLLMKISAHAKSCVAHSQFAKTCRQFRNAAAKPLSWNTQMHVTRMSYSSSGGAIKINKEYIKFYTADRYILLSQDIAEIICLKFENFKPTKLVFYRQFSILSKFPKEDIENDWIISHCFDSMSFVNLESLAYIGMIIPLSILRRQAPLGLCKKYKTLELTINEKSNLFHMPAQIKYIYDLFAPSLENVKLNICNDDGSPPGFGVFGNLVLLKSWDLSTINPQLFIDASAIVTVNDIRKKHPEIQIVNDTGDDSITIENLELYYIPKMLPRLKTLLINGTAFGNSQRDLFCLKKSTRLKQVEFNDCAIENSDVLNAANGMDSVKMTIGVTTDNFLRQICMLNECKTKHVQILRWSSYEVDLISNSTIFSGKENTFITELDFTGRHTIGIMNISGLKNLELFRFGANRGTVSEIAFPNSLTRLEWKPMYQVDAPSILSALANCTNLKTLILFEVGFDAICASSSFKFINLNHLEELDIKPISDIGEIKHIPWDVLRFPNTITSLTTRFGYGQTFLMSAVSSHCPVKKLTLHSANIIQIIYSLMYVEKSLRRPISSLFSTPSSLSNVTELGATETDTETDAELEMKLVSFWPDLHYKLDESRNEYLAPKSYKKSLELFSQALEEITIHYRSISGELLSGQHDALISSFFETYSHITKVRIIYNSKYNRDCEMEIAQILKVLSLFKITHLHLQDNVEQQDYRKSGDYLRIQSIKQQLLLQFSENQWKNLQEFKWYLPLPLLHESTDLNRYDSQNNIITTANWEEVDQIDLKTFSPRLNVPSLAYTSNSMPVFIDGSGTSPPSGIIVDTTTTTTNTIDKTNETNKALFRDELRKAIPSLQKIELLYKRDPESFEYLSFV